MTSIEDRFARLRITRELGENVSKLVEDDVTGFFAELRTEMVEEIIDAPIADDNKRRDAAAFIKIIDRFVEHVSSAIANGDQAAKRLVKLEEGIE